MRDFFVRAISGFLILLFLLYVAPTLNIEWVQTESPYRVWIVPIAIIGGWGGLYLYKKIEKRFKRNNGEV